MSGTKKAEDITADFLETFLSTIYEDGEKEIVRRVVKCFTDFGLPVKTKQYSQACMAGTFRILCFIKKSAEAVIINNKDMGRDGMSIQVRIDDRSTLNKLDVFSENVRNQILSANDCRYCSTKCEGKRYVFGFNGNEYVKCQMLCSNFVFRNIGKNDIDGIMDIISNEIDYKKKRTK